jgi:hypothetical protein
MYHLPRFSTLLNIHDKLLLLLFELGPFPVQFTLRLGERTLMLP